MPKRKALRHEVNEALLKLAIVRDLLVRMENGNPLGMAPQDCAGFARATFEETAKKLEAALIDLRVVAPDACYFIEDARHG